MADVGRFFIGVIAFAALWFLWGITIMFGYNWISPQVITWLGISAPAVMSYPVALLLTSALMTLRVFYTRIPVNKWKDKGKERTLNETAWDNLIFSILIPLFALCILFTLTAVTTLL